MREEELLYEALKKPLGLVCKADARRLREALAKLKKSDPALLELVVLGPAPNGDIFIFRTVAAGKIDERRD